ncbi:MAG TPA: FMN-binding negative transcriptional regulator [Luteibacter sp.]|jgi:transcriptional regulator|nr:FMN-binding negative transcriptional regulator [Luteibacter sp.]
MYTPTAFLETRLPVIQQAMYEIAFASLVSHGESGLIASHLPLLLVAEEGPYGTLYGHVARANTQWRELASESLAIFSGPHAYVSPNAYPGKQAHGREVPTWNYIAVHAYGRAGTFDDPVRLRWLLDGLTGRHETETQASPWQVADAPADYIEGMLRAIVGIRLPIARLEGKWKLSQNRQAADRDGAADELATRATERERAVAAAMTLANR